MFLRRSAEQKKNKRRIAGYHLLKIHRVVAIGPFSEANALNSYPTLGYVVMFSCGEEEDPQKHVLPLFLSLPPLPPLFFRLFEQITHHAPRTVRSRAAITGPPQSEKMIIRNDEKVIRRKQHLWMGRRRVIVALVRSSANTQNPIQGGKPQQQHET